MWTTIRPFHYRGRNFKVGDAVPAEKWPARRIFVSRGRIQWVESEGDATPPQKPLHKMTRAELNDYATGLGIEDAAEYPNRDALLEKIDEVDEETSPVETPADGLEPELEDDELEPETVEVEEEKVVEVEPVVEEEDSEDDEDEDDEITPTVE